MKRKVESAVSDIQADSRSGGGGEKAKASEVGGPRWAVSARDREEGARNRRLRCAIWRDLHRSHRARFAERLRTRGLHRRVLLID